MAAPGPSDNFQAFLHCLNGFSCGFEKPWKRSFRKSKAFKVSGVAACRRPKASFTGPAEVKVVGFRRNFGSARFVLENFRRGNFCKAWAPRSVWRATRGSKNHGKFKFLDSWRLRALTRKNAKYPPWKAPNPTGHLLVVGDLPHGPSSPLQDALPFSRPSSQLKGIPSHPWSPWWFPASCLYLAWSRSYTDIQIQLLLNFYTETQTASDLTTNVLFKDPLLEINQPFKTMVVPFGWYCWWFRNPAPVDR